MCRLTFAKLRNLDTKFEVNGSRNLSDWWLAHWMSEAGNNSSNKTFDEVGSYASYQKSNSGIEDYKFYIMVYGTLAGIGGAVALVRAFSFAFGGIRAAVYFHSSILRTILRASVQFFDLTPVGRIVNRFSSDTYVIDDDLPFVLNILLAQSFSLAGSLVIICYSMPWLLLVLVPLGAIYYQIQNYYRHTSRDVRRLEAVTLSPIYSHFSETVLGLTSIRAFRSEARFKKENEERLEKNQRAMFSLGAISAWLNLRLQMIGVAVVTGIAIMAVFQHHLQGIDPGLVGLALSYGLSVTSVLRALVEFWTETEKHLVSVERTVQYIDSVESERWEGFIKPPPYWPDNGVVAFHSVMLRYRTHLPLALKSVTFRTNPGEKLGIVGRTGAGKSSLFTALFRLVEVEKGGITVDGQVLAYLDLKDLRANITMIPQDPFVISGTVRENLTSSIEITDDELWLALQQCHLAEKVERLGGLDADLGERGGTLSMGQRQLLCLCRAVLTKPKVLCIDEATANIDQETDRFLQQTIRNTFKDTTVLTVAHRLETVMDSDRILVMDQGMVVEMDTPKNLLADPNSHFYQLVQRQEWAS